MSTDHDQFGATINGSRWYNQRPDIREVPVQSIHQHWMCPIEGCHGEMIFNGSVWPTAPPGNHHTCNECGFTAALRGLIYPQVVYREVTR